ncbi:hypothetical protein, partial [Niallia circulans]|uniref:hypothetical protein n=1 Tax=Niallia circulans TaxID=1397 RepID=UPI001C26AA2F
FIRTNINKQFVYRQGLFFKNYKNLKTSLLKKNKPVSILSIFAKQLNENFYNCKYKIAVS